MSKATASRYAASAGVAVTPPNWAAVSDIETNSRPKLEVVPASSSSTLGAKDVGCRILNVAVAVVAIAICAIPMVLVALAVRVTSPGPVIYKQPRVGLDRRNGRGWQAERGRRRLERRGDRTADTQERRAVDRRADSRRDKDQGGRIFTIYKFRTMRVAEPNADQVWSSKSDPRITPIGKFLRASRLDELPQFFNVLMGDMNIVGPRPEQPKIFEELSEEVRNYRDRQRVLPGITGLAQVRLGYDETVDGVQRKVDLDLEYISRRSAKEDLMIMAKTMPVMVFQKVWM